MAKGRGHHGQQRKKEARRDRGRTPAKTAGTGQREAAHTASPVRAVAAPARGVAATRGAVSSAYRAWAADYGRRQARALAAEFAAPEGSGIPPDLFVLAPLTTRTVTAPSGEAMSVQMGLPIVATRAGGVTVAPDRLALVVLRLPEADPGSALAMFGLGQAPDLPPPEALFALQVPAEGLRAARPADAVAWYVARAVEAGDVPVEPRALAQAVGEALALLRPAAAPRNAAPLDAALLEAYTGYGADADEEAVPLDIAAPPARGGLAGLPAGAYLQDNGALLAPLLADLRDYVVGLWPFDYFGLDRLTADPTAADTHRAQTLAALADIVRRLDEVLAQSSEDEEATLAAEGRPPAWIAEETAHYRAARQELRATRIAQELLPRLGPILFDLEIPPADYAPPGMTGMIEELEMEEET